MKKLKLLPALLVCILFLSHCMKEDQDSDNDLGYTALPTVASQSINGNISNGERLASLDWAWSSSNACFVEPAASRFQGNHVFYQIELPTNSIITINLTPSDPSKAMGLYAYSKAAGNVTFPESLNSAVSCEADPSNNNGSTTGNRSVELNAISNPYSIMIGVAGAVEISEAAFTLEINIES